MCCRDLDSCCMERLPAIGSALAQLRFVRIHLCRQEAISTACHEPCHEPWVWRPLKPGSTMKFLAEQRLVLHWNLYPSLVCCCSFLFIVHASHTADSGSRCLNDSKTNHKTQSVDFKTVVYMNIRYPTARHMICRIYVTDLRTERAAAPAGCGIVVSISIRPSVSVLA